MAEILIKINNENGSWTDVVIEDDIPKFKTYNGTELKSVTIIDNPKLLDDLIRIFEDIKKRLYHSEFRKRTKSIETELKDKYGIIDKYEGLNKEG